MFKAKQCRKRRIKRELKWPDCKAWRSAWYCLGTTVRLIGSFCKQLRQKGLLPSTFSLLSELQQQPTWSKRLWDKGLREPMNADPQTLLNVRQLVYCKRSFWRLCVTVVWVTCCCTLNLRPQMEKRKGNDKVKEDGGKKWENEKMRASAGGYLLLDGCC